MTHFWDDRYHEGVLHGRRGLVGHLEAIMMHQIRQHRFRFQQRQKLTNTHTRSLHKREKGVWYDVFGGEKPVGVVEGGLRPEARVVVGALDVDHDGGALMVCGVRRVGKEVRECVIEI